MYNSSMTAPKKPLWFKAKQYGWGWYPVTWQGYAITLGFGLAYAALFILLLSWLGVATIDGGADYRQSSLSALEFIAAFALLTWGMIAICSRYGERPRWRWGRDAD